jgi:hypothetical protein
VAESKTAVVTQAKIQLGKVSFYVKIFCKISIISCIYYRIMAHVFICIKVKVEWNFSKKSTLTEIWHFFIIMIKVSARIIAHKESRNWMGLFIQVQPSPPAPGIGPPGLS